MGTDWGGGDKVTHLSRSEEKAHWKKTENHGYDGRAAYKKHHQKKKRSGHGGERTEAPATIGESLEITTH